VTRSAVCLLAGCLLLAACAREAPSLPPGVEAAPVHDGRWLVINYWAIWCKPCREEIPELNAFAEEQAGNVIVYGVNYDDARGEELLVQAAELAIEFPLLARDPAATLGYARPMVLPTTLLIDPAGAVHARLLGPQTSATLLQAMQDEAQLLAPPLN
jgi:thiol-disulfide isomerase/thioredoxin